MKANSLRAAACSLLVASSASVEAAAVDYFLKFTNPTLVGSSTDKAFKGSSVIADFSWGIEVAYPTGTGGGGQVKPVITLSDFSWTQSVDTVVPDLLDAIQNGDTFQKAELHARTISSGSSFEFFTMEFSQVNLTSYSITGGSGEPPSFAGAFKFDKLVLKVIPQKPDGTAGDPVIGTFEQGKINASSAVFAQLADFSAPVPELAPIPLPATLPFLLSGLGGLVLAGRRKLRGHATEDTPASA
jgi:type VI protein secretion system component Hcp